MSWKKQWVRILISFLVGGSLQEIVRIKTGNDKGGLLVLGGVICYIFISFASYFHTIYTIQKKIDRENHVNQELIDDLK